MPRLYASTWRSGAQAASGGTPPEEIHRNYPLIRNAHSAKVRPISPSRVYSIKYNQLREAGFIVDGDGPRYDLRVHSIRKYFCTQLAALGVKQDYIEYMMDTPSAPIMTFR